MSAVVHMLAGASALETLARQRFTRRESLMVNTSWSGQRRAFPTRMRAQILHLFPVCVACGLAPSTVADHILSHADCIRAGIHPDTISNGQGMCAPCHAVKTKAEARAGRARQPRAKRSPEQHPGLRW